MKKKRMISTTVYHVFVMGLGIVMIYPLLWMIFSSFKPTNTIFTTAQNLLPSQWTFENYANGWRGFGKVGFSQFFSNSAFISVIATIGTVLSSSIVAYGFARMKFFGRKMLFAAMLVIIGILTGVLFLTKKYWVYDEGM